MIQNLWPRIFVFVLLDWTKINKKVKNRIKVSRGYCPLWHNHEAFVLLSFRLGTDCALNCALRVPVLSGNTIISRAYAIFHMNLTFLTEMSEKIWFLYLSSVHEYRIFLMHELFCHFSIIYFQYHRSYFLCSSIMILNSPVCFIII